MAHIFSNVDEKYRARPGERKIKMLIFKPSFDPSKQIKRDGVLLHSGPIKSAAWCLT